MYLFLLIVWFHLLIYSGKWIHTWTDNWRSNTRDTIIGDSSHENATSLDQNPVWSQTAAVTTSCRHQSSGPNVINHIISNIVALCSKSSRSNRCSNFRNLTCPFAFPRSLVTNCREPVCQLSSRNDWHYLGWTWLWSNFKKPTTESLPLLSCWLPIFRLFRYNVTMNLFRAWYRGKFMNSSLKQFRFT